MEFAKVEITPEGVFSPAFGDWYFSVPDGVAESRYVYFDANDVVAGYAQAAGGAGAAGFTVAELGFGTGLN
ncbi:MAG: hypothetical protein D6B26_07465, partial [Spirochaetaceae bacterium]